VLICYVIWGILPLFWRYLSAVASFGVLGYRIVFSLLFIALFLLAAGRWGEAMAMLRDRAERRRLMCSGAAVAVNWGGYIWAVSSGHVLDASLAYYMHPILSILVGALFFREKLTKLQWLAVGLMASGIAVTAASYGQVPWLALLIGGSFVLYGVLKRGVTSSAPVSLFGESLFTAPLALVCIIWCESTGAGALAAFSGFQWLLLPAAGIVTALPLLFFSQGIRTTANTLAGVLMLINPTLQRMLGVFVMGEAFTATHAVLFAFIWSGLALFLLGSLRSRKKELI